jgi:hypothetical protein
VQQGWQFLEQMVVGLDPSKNPKTINAMVLQGKHKGEVMLGIYELKDNRLRLCFDTEGQKRPTDFKAAGPGLTLGVYRHRRGPADEPPDITGKYTVESEVPAPQQDVLIERRGEGYLLSYMKDGVVVSYGMAIRKGNTLSMCWVMQGMAGVAVYQIEKGPRLVGQYLTLGSTGKLVGEKLIPARGKD